MKIGYSENKITPDIGTSIPGYFENRISTGVLDELLTCAVAFSNGIATSIFISVDILEFHQEFSDLIRDTLSEKTCVPRDNILIAATHTHNGHAMNYRLFGSPENHQVMHNTAQTVIRTGYEAFKNITEQKCLYTDATVEGVAFCRNFYMKDGTIKTNPSSTDNIVRAVSKPDNKLDVMLSESTDGKITGIIVNFACHPDTIGGTMFSADWPGVMREQLKKKYGSDVTVVFFNGAAGDLNHLDRIEHSHIQMTENGTPFYIAIGNKIAENVGLAVSGAKPENKPEHIEAVCGHFLAKRRQPDKKDLAWAQEVLSNPNDFRVSENVYATELTELAEHPILQTAYEIQTLVIGDWAVVGVPCELFNEIARDIKKKSPFAKTVVFELANGSIGYVSPDYIINSTTYESKLSKYNSFVVPEEAKLITGRVLNQLDRLLKKIGM